MRRVRKSECAVLHLVLKHKWFDMIERGEKREEYRDLDKWHGRIIRLFIRAGAANATSNAYLERIVVAFHRGYRKPSLFFKLALPHGIATTSFLASIPLSRPRCLHPEWGEPETPHFVIRLGERVVLEEDE